jgi:hypothetical protein
MEARRRQSLASMPAFGAAMIERRTSGRWVWLVILLLVLAGGGLLLARQLGAL